MDDPPYLTVGTEVSAKYKGAFCEAKIRKVVRVVKCRVLFKSGLGSFLLSDDAVKGTLRVGGTVEAKHPDRGSYSEATISKIQDCSQYTVVFDDGDITTLRRSALCLKSGRHFNESETLDQLPLTHPEHFSNPVVGGSGRRGVRARRVANTDDKDDSSDEEETSTSPTRGGRKKMEPHEIDFGKVVTVEISDKKKGSRDSWFPALVVSPAAQETVKIRVKDECLVRSFKDGRYYTVPKKEITEFAKEFQPGKGEPSSTGLKTAVEKAVSYLDKDELPPHWDRDALFGSIDGGDGDDGDSDSETSDEVVREKKDNFVAQLYKFMEERGTPINKAPTVCFKDLDLHKLYSVVVDQGGYSKVTNGGQWKNITGRLGFGSMPSTSTINLVKQAYKKYLLHFEELNKKLGYNIHTAAISKPRNSRSVYRQTGTPVPPSGSGAGTSTVSKKEAIESAAIEEKNVEEEKETDSSSREAESQKKGDDEPRRSRSRQDSSRSSRKDTPKEKEKDIEEKETKKRGKSSKEKEVNEPVVVLKQQREREVPEPEEEPPSPVQSSQGSSKSKTSIVGGRVGSQRKGKKEAVASIVTNKEIEVEPPPVKVVEKPIDQSPGAIGKDVKIQMGDKLSVIYPKGDHNVTYDAKVVDVNDKAGTFFVHYLGWNIRYDEWISRGRIAENLSLRENYQSKAQGKGPGPVIPPSSHFLEDKEEKGKGKKRGRSVTPAPPSAPTPPPTTPSSSTTGTRSKTASAANTASAPSPTPAGGVKRKRLSTSERSVTDEPTVVKKKRSYKKSEKSVASDSESEQEILEKIIPFRTPTPTRSSKMKEKKQTVSSVTLPPQDEKRKEATLSSSNIGKEDVKEAKKEAQQVLDLAAIRSEMKGVDKMVKVSSASKTPSPVSGNSAPPKMSISPPNLVPGGEQKLDIYDFEEDSSEAPKLKMFSPRSPDKKDDKEEVIKDKVTGSTPPVPAVVVTTVPSPAKGKGNASSIITTTVITPAPGVTVMTTPIQIPVGKQPTISGAVLAQPQQQIITTHPPPLSVGRSPPRGRAQLGQTHPPIQHRGRSPNATPTVVAAATVPQLPRLTGPPQTVTIYSAPMPMPPFGVGATGPVPIQSSIIIPRPPMGTEGSLLSPHVSMIRTPTGGMRQPPPGAVLLSSVLTGSTPLSTSGASTTKDSKPQISGGITVSGLQPNYARKQEVTFTPGGPQQKFVGNKLQVGPFPASTAGPISTPAADTSNRKKPRTPSKPRPSPSDGKRKDKPLSKAAISAAAVHQGKESTSAVLPKPKKRRGESPSKGSQPKPTVPIPPPSKLQKIELAQPQAPPSPFVERAIPVKDITVRPSQLAGHTAISKINETISNLMQKTPLPVVTGITTITPTSAPPPIPIAHKDTHVKKSTILPAIPLPKSKPYPLVELIIPSTCHEKIPPVQIEAKLAGPTPIVATVPQQKVDRNKHVPLTSQPPLIAATIAATIKPVPTVIPTLTFTQTDRASGIITTQNQSFSAEPKPKPAPHHQRASIIETSGLPQTLPQQPKDKSGKPERKEKMGKINLKESPATHQQPRPLTPSFLQSQEVLEPEDDEQEKGSTKKEIAYTLSAKAVLLSVGGVKDSAEESCSSLLCEEEIPGSPAPGPNESSKFDFSSGFGQGHDDDEDDDDDDEEDEDRVEEKAKKKKPAVSSRPTLLPKKGSVQHMEQNKPRLVVERSESLVVMHDSPPSSPDSTSFSTETGSPHIDSGRISAQGDMEEEDKSKDSSDNDSGDDNAKSYYSGSPSTPSRKSSKTEPPPSPKISLSRMSRPHLPISSALGKKRRMMRKKSPTDDYARQFGYRGIRSSSGRKIQSSIDVHEAIRGPPPPPVNLAKRPHSDKFNHLYANLEGIVDPEERIALVMKSMQDIREEWLKVKNKIQARERKERRRKRRAREKATAERQARLEAAKTLASQSQQGTGAAGPALSVVPTSTSS